MHKVPKIVVGRLKADLPAAGHPDANLLAAFSEKSLSQKERRLVLEHLARCSDCREILSLAMPEPDRELEIVEGSAVGGWFTWPALRWGLVTAGLLVVGFGVLQYQRYGRISSVAVSKSLPSPMMATEPRNEAQPPSSPSSQAMTARAKDEHSELTAKASESRGAGEAARQPASPPPPAAKPGNVVVSSPAMGTLAHGPRMNQLNQNAQANQAAQQAATGADAPVPAQSEMVEVEAQAPSDNVPVNGRQLAELKRLDQAAAGATTETRVERVKPIEGIVLSSAPKAQKSAPADALRDASAGIAAPAWTISSTGALQRSFDHGRTWQDVNVTNLATDAGAASMAYSSTLQKETVPVTQDKQKDQFKNNKKADGAKIAAPVVFRAVSANGADVWAGGASGLLYHSQDSGVHWLRVVPFTNDSFLTGDIVSLVFADPQHGKVTTSTSETWVTADAGGSWQKQ